MRFCDVNFEPIIYFYFLLGGKVLEHKRVKNHESHTRLVLICVDAVALRTEISVFVTFQGI